MTSNLNSGITRRSLLSTTAKGALGLSMIGSLGLRANATPLDSTTYWTKSRTERHLCGQIHAAKGSELTRLLHSPNLDQAEKNLALKTTHCPKCKTRIHPTQVIDPYVVAA